ncbi:MAG: 2-aminobenzoate-CoA ligase, partial [Bauldia litoralis]
MRDGDRPALRFADRFNVAVPFIDRHVAEGRGEKAAIRTLDGQEISYASLAASVGRCGNLLKAMGVAPDARVL